MQIEDNLESSYRRNAGTRHHCCGACNACSVRGISGMSTHTPLSYTRTDESVFFFLVLNFDGRGGTKDSCSPKERQRTNLSSFCVWGRTTDVAARIWSNCWRRRVANSLKAKACTCERRRRRAAGMDVGLNCKKAWIMQSC